MNITYEEFEKILERFINGGELECNLLDKIICKDGAIFGYVFLAQLCEKTYHEGKNEQYQIIKKEFLKLLESLDNPFIMEEYGNILLHLKNTDVIDTLCDIVSPSLLIEKIDSNNGKNVKTFIKLAEYYKGYFKRNMFFKLPNGRIFIEFLLEFDKDFVLELLSEDDKNILQINYILKVKDFDLNFLFEQPWFFTEDDGYFDYFRKSIEDSNYSPTVEERELLDKFDIMMDSYENDRFVVSRIKNFYIKQFAKKIPDAFRDLSFLISIKKKYPSFRVVRKPNFSADACLITSSDFALAFTPIAACMDGQITHEITHIFHYCYSKLSTPQEFEEIRKRSTNNIDEVMKKIITYFGSRFSKAYEKVREIEMDVEKTSKFLEMVNLETQIFYEEYKRRLISNYYELFDVNLLGYVSENLISREEYYEYVKKCRANFIAQIKVLSDELYESFAIIDIINCLYGGKMEPKLAEFNRHYKLVTVYHEKDYFDKNLSIEFAEILANYVTLKKSEKYEEYKKILEDILGAEIVNYLEDFYNNLSLEDLIKQERQM